MLTCLDGVLLCRQAEGIIAHGMKDIEALESLVAGVDVACYIAQGMSHVQTCSRRVGKHVEHIVLRLGFVFRYLVGTFSGPAFLPLAFYFFEIVFHILILQRVCKHP